MENAAKENAVVMSASGLKAAREELEYLKTVRRKELAEEIKEARSHGDLSENSEYDEAKNTQGLVENRIAELENLVRVAIVVDTATLEENKVMVGMHVTVQREDAQPEQYDIVSSTEADPFHGRISDASPVGASLIGKTVQDTAEVLLPTGRTVLYKVLDIRKSA